MTRLDQPAGGFGGPRIVKPQANVYTVLLLVACLFVAAALGLEILRLRKLQNPPEVVPKAGAADHARVTAVAVRAAPPIARLM